MAYAYALSPGKEKASALSNVRSGYRECTETLCALEVQIEQLIGTLTLEMKGMIVFMIKVWFNSTVNLICFMDIVHWWTSFYCYCSSLMSGTFKKKIAISF